MKKNRLWRLALIAVGTIVLTLGAFWTVWKIRIYRELNPPAPQPTSAQSIRVMAGFKVELLHAAKPNEDSWINMTADSQGRFLISPHNGKLIRLTVEHGKIKKTERIDVSCTDAMGMLYASNYLFLDCRGPQGLGVYRARDLGDHYGAPELLRRVNFWVYDHGAHGFALGPDGKLYMVCGNATELPADVSTHSPLRNYAEDALLPSDPDPTGLEISHKAVSGFVLRMDLDGKNCELFAGGTRNNYCIAFNADGELFGADNDMNWEWGVPWYRLCRVNHFVSGGDFGYREGTSKFPAYDEDILPGTHDIGLGAPTGVKFAPTNCAFPAAYRDACFVQDWAFGRLLAVHLVPHGASYDAFVETILHGKPLTMSAMEFGPDGNLYFITGGHETESGFYRVSFTGKTKPAAIEVNAKQIEDAKEARRLRHELESFQGHADPRAVDTVWPSLNSNDRWIRYAARVALEAQPIAEWQQRAVSETNIYGGLTALMALARCGLIETQESLLGALDKFPLAHLNHEQQLLKLRVLELSFARQGKPNDVFAKRCVDQLNPLYPAANDDLNYELCQLLLFLDAPNAVPRTMALLQKAQTQEEQTYYVFRLRTITNGWTPELRKEYLTWFPRKRDLAAHSPDVLAAFKEVELDYSDGPGYEPFINNFRDEFVAAMSPAERQELDKFIPPKTNVFHPLISPVIVTGAKFFKHWRVAELDADESMLQWHRSFAKGRQIFNKVGCVLCHRFANSGGSAGPDLTGVASRLTTHGILESIIEPSKVLPEQFQNTVIETPDGDIVTGRIMDETPQRIVIMTDLIGRTTVEIPAKNIVSRRISKISPMPEGLVDTLTESEIWDLLAFLENGGKPAPIHTPSATSSSK